jgi:hypothetical protein
MKRAITPFLSTTFLKLKLRARRLYRRQAKLRLPRTRVSRRRARYACRGVYTSNSLRTPSSAAGRRAIFLPPANIFSLTRVLGRVEHTGGALRATRQGVKNAVRFRPRPR